jgi:hypothetical protein
MTCWSVQVDLKLLIHKPVKWHWEQVPYVSHIVQHLNMLIYYAITVGFKCSTLDFQHSGTIGAEVVPDYQEVLKAGCTHTIYSIYTLHSVYIYKYCIKY